METLNEKTQSTTVLETQSTQFLGVELEGIETVEQTQEEILEPCEAEQEIEIQDSEHWILIKKKSERFAASSLSARLTQINSSSFVVDSRILKF